MAKKIYKYAIGVDGQSAVLKGHFSRILKIMVQEYWPYVWMEVDEENYDEVEIEFKCVGTGWEYLGENVGQYVDSCIDGGGFVWHYFVDNPVFLSREEKEQMEEYMKYQQMMSNLFTGGYVEDSSSGIITKEPKIDLF